MIAERLLVLRARFLERSRADCDRLLEAVAEIEPDLAAIGSIAHRLAGGGGTMGLPAISEAAAVLEEACDARDLVAMRAATAALDVAVGTG